MALVEVVWVGKKQNIAAVYLCNAPVNIFSPALIKDIGDTLHELKTMDRCQGVIMLSKFGNTKRNVFSAGFDLSLFAKNDRALSREYLEVWFNSILEMHSFGKPIVMAINGKNIAGGAVMAMAADYRIIKRAGTLHYIESQVGISLVPFIFECVSRVTGGDVASYVFQTAVPLKAEECLRLGLVNEMVEDDEALMERAITVLETKYFNGMIEAAASARNIGRKYYIDFIENDVTRNRDIEGLMDAFHSDGVQKFIRKYLSAAKRPKKKSKL